MATKNTTAPRLEEVKGIRKTFGQNAVLKDQSERGCRSRLSR